MLKEAENQIREYQAITDAEKIQELFRRDYEKQRTLWLEKKQELLNAMWRNKCISDTALQ